MALVGPSNASGVFFGLSSFVWKSRLHGVAIVPLHSDFLDDFLDIKSTS